jgi:hypothetical protein
VLIVLMRSTVVAWVAVVLLIGHPEAADLFTTALTFPVTDERAEFTIDISRDVVVRIQRDGQARGRVAAWDFVAIDRRLTDSPNFFDECLCGHGPRLHELSAWHFVERYFPPERMLPVYGYPFEIRVRCLACETTGSGADTQFASGTVEVGWRRLSTSNPRPLRISDIVPARH